MTKDEKATAACCAAMARTDALSWQAALTLFRVEKPGAQILRANPNNCLLTHALTLASVGLKPVPMDAQSKRPARKGWREAASLDPDAIAVAFNAAPYTDALGIVTGGGVFVIDLDRNHKDGADGVAAFADLIARHGAGKTLALGPRVRTPGGGVHLYFGSPPGRRVRNRTALAPGVDVRGEGGVAMVPPSARDGVAYRWTPAPWECAPPQAPTWLLHVVAPIEAPRPMTASVRPYRGEASVYARVALERELNAVASAALGTRNAALNKAAASLSSLCAAGALPAGPVANALLEAARVNGLVGDDGEAAARATIASGFKYGLAHPRALTAKQRGGRP